MLLVVVEKEVRHVSLKKFQSKFIAKSKDL
jgi:hypothetical protein